jgi:hypothetical protein
MAVPDIINTDYEQGGIFGGMTKAQEASYGVSYPSSISSTAYASFVPALTSLLGLSGTLSDIEQQGDAAVKNIESLATTQRFTQAQKSYQLEQMNEVLGDKLSMSGLEALKREATLKAASAETGSTTQQEVIEQAFIDENFRNSQIVRDSRIEKDSLKMSMIADRLNFSNQMESIQYSMMSPLSAGLKTFGSGLQGFNYGLGMLPSSISNISLGVDTTGTKTQG